jgi:hypothetical protein
MAQAVDRFVAQPSFQQIFGENLFSAFQIICHVAVTSSVGNLIVFLRQLSVWWLFTA